MIALNRDLDGVTFRENLYTGALCPADCPDVDACQAVCKNYDFFQCFAVGQLQTCNDACARAISAQITQYLDCARAATASCDLSCLADLPQP